VEIEAKAKAQGISRSTLFRVKGPLGVKVWRIGEGWSWSLPRETDGSLETDGIVETDGTLA
jgi:hypothetical protein